MNKELSLQQWGMMIGRKARIDETIINIDGIRVSDYQELAIIDEVGWEWLTSDYEIKPILRNLDQMTEEEKEEFFKFIKDVDYNEVSEIKFNPYSIEFIWNVSNELYFKEIRYFSVEMQDWFTQKGFDIRNWIDAGLAIKYDPIKHGEWI